MLIMSRTMETGAVSNGFDFIEVKKTTSVVFKYPFCVLLKTESASRKANIADIRKNSQQSGPRPLIRTEGRLRPHETIR